MEGNHPHLDIPVSCKVFETMKKSGEFLATSHILGRPCGFSTSQVGMRKSEEIYKLIDCALWEDEKCLDEAGRE